eukprot:4490598-Pyramimonas_sp.AAC.1
MRADLLLRWEAPSKRSWARERARTDWVSGHPRLPAIGLADAGAAISVSRGRREITSITKSVQS